MTFFNFVIMIVVFVGLSLACSYVLFKVLKSSATIKKPKVQLGGAIAGFVTILGLLLYSFNTWYGTWKPPEWTICVKKVMKEMDHQNGENVGHGGIVGRVLAPSKMNLTQGNGYFTLNGVPKTAKEGWPRIIFEYDGYEPIIIDKLNDWAKEENSDEIKIDEANKTIFIEKPIILAKIGGGS